MNLGDSIRTAVAGGGLLLAGATFIAGNFSGGYIEPGGRIGDAFTPTEQACPSGWANNSVKADHVVIKSCERDGWLVVLNAEGQFSHGYMPNVQGAAFVFDSEKVPNWPR